MLKPKKGSFTQVALVTVVTCLCLGLICGLLVAPICWHCGRTDRYAKNQKPADIGEIVVYESNVRTHMRWFCSHCRRAWKNGTPWIDDPPNLMQRVDHEDWPWKGHTSAELVVPDGRRAEKI